MLSGSRFPVADTPISETMLPVDAIHTLYVREYGNPNGIPAVVCHGGPGAGCKPEHAGYFDQDKYRVILFDQRGAGRSIPSGSLERNTTPFLIADLEIIRKHFKIEKWTLFGGSWGSTLALLYAEAHPERVLGLILRGIFLAREKDCKSFYQENSPAALCNPAAWNEFKTTINNLDSNSELDLLTRVYNLFKNDNSRIREQAATALSKWEETIAYFTPPPKTDSYNSAININPLLIEVAYTINNCFISENKILNDLGKIPNVPVYIIHGKADFICPQEQAFALAEAFYKRGIKVDYQECLAGHAGSEPTVVNTVIKATNALASMSELHNFNLVK